MYQITDLLRLMARLRDAESGCPWDIEQSFATIVPHTIEEMYEVVDAIDNHDMENLSEELGDLLFQIIFYAQLGKESGAFDFHEIVHGVTAKLLRRHPHVFPDGTLASRRPKGVSADDIDVRGQWDEIKAQEKSSGEVSAYLDSVPRALPAITRALKLQKKASKVGFDWGAPGPVMDKISEELDEFSAALKSGDLDSIEDELGDVLFAVVNLARLVRVDPELALRRTNKKFYDRFAYVESNLALKDITLREATLAQMDALWEEAKTQL